MNEQPGIGHAQTFGPVLVPGRNIPKNSWDPVIPERVWPPRALIAAAVPFFFMAFLPDYSPRLAGQAYYPDFARKDEVHASRVPSTFSPHVNLANFPVPHLSWKGHQPDQVDPPQALGAHQQRSFQANYDPIISYNPALDAPHFRVTPDLVMRLPELRHTHPAFFATNALPQYAVPDRSWAGQYPDRLNQPPRLESAPFLFRDTFPQVPKDGRAQYPDRIDRHQPHPQGWYARPLREPDDIARLGWRGHQPPAIHRDRPHPQGYYVRPLREPDDIARLGWRGHQPPAVYRDRPSYAGWWSGVLVEPADIARLGWRGYQPAWLPLPRATQPNAGILDPFPRPDVQAPRLFAWAIYPDAVFRDRPSYQGWFTGPVQNPQLVPLSWRPDYPALVPRLPIWQTAGAVLGPLPQVPFDWRIPQPDPILRRLPTPGWITEALQVQAPLVPLSWKAQYPDWFQVRQRQPGIALTDPLPPQVPPLSWQPVYPERLIHRPVPPTSGIIDPFPRPPAPYDPATFPYIHLPGIILRPAPLILVSYAGPVMVIRNAPVCVQFVVPVERRRATVVAEKRRADVGLERRRATVNC